MTSTPTQHLTPTAAGLACPGCGHVGVKTTKQTFKDGSTHVRAVCANCGRFLRYLPKHASGEPALKVEMSEPRPGATDHPAFRPPPAAWRWIGWIRLADMVWRPVADAATLGRCWDALLHYPGQGDRLCTPVQPSPAGKEDTAA